MPSIPKPKVTVILANLGTPDAATAPAVREFCDSSYRISG